MEENNSIKEDTKIVETTKCLNCGTEFQGNFCPECGQRADTNRLTIHAILKNLLLAILSNDGGIWITLKSLFTRPGAMMVDILNGKRKSYFSPFPMLFLTLALYIMVFSFSGSNDIDWDNVIDDSASEDVELVEADDSKVLENDILEIIKWSYVFYINHYTLFSVLTIPLYLLGARIFYGRQNRKRYFRGEYIVPIVYSLIILILYRCLTDVVYCFSHDLYAKITSLGLIIIVNTIALTMCFKKMIGFSTVKTMWRSLLILALYYSIIGIVLFGALAFYFYQKL